jgi:hypothetical protein
VRCRGTFMSLVSTLPRQPYTRGLLHHSYALLLLIYSLGVIAIEYPRLCCKIFIVTVIERASAMMIRHPKICTYNTHIMDSILPHLLLKKCDSPYPYCEPYSGDGSCDQIRSFESTSAQRDSLKLSCLLKVTVLHSCTVSSGVKIQNELV